MWRYVAVTRSISFTIYCEIEKHPIPSDGSSSPTKCAPPTYPWNWSATSRGDYTCRRNAVNGLRRNVLRRRNGRLYKFPIRSVRPFRRSLVTVMERRRSRPKVRARPYWSMVNGRLYKFPIRSVRPSVVVLSLSWSGGDRNYTDTTTILNASEVTVALPLYGE